MIPDLPHPGSPHNKNPIVCGMPLAIYNSLLLRKLSIDLTILSLLVKNLLLKLQLDCQGVFSIFNSLYLFILNLTLLEPKVIILLVLVNNTL
jgi:hypothetical protein